MTGAYAVEDAPSLRLCNSLYVNTDGRLELVRVADTVIDDRTWVLASDVARVLDLGDKWQRVTWAVGECNRVEADRDRVLYDGTIHTTPSGTVWMVADDSVYDFARSAAGGEARAFSDWVGRTLLGDDRMEERRLALVRSAAVRYPIAAEPAPQTLYRLYNGTRKLLYVGISLNAARRLSDHRRGKPWWSQVAHITLEHFPDRPSVEAAEARAIRTEKPRHNVAHPVDRSPAGATG